MRDRKGSGPTSGSRRKTWRSTTAPPSAAPSSQSTCRPDLSWPCTRARPGPIAPRPEAPPVADGGEPRAVLRPQLVAPVALVEAQALVQRADLPVGGAQPLQ